MKTLALSILIFGFTLPVMSEEVVTVGTKNYQIPDINVCFKSTVGIDSVEPYSDNSYINLTTFSIHSEFLDCSVVDKKTAIINMQNYKPILINGDGKIVEFISSIDTKTTSTGDESITFEKNDFFVGHGTMFNSKNNRCYKLEAELLETKKMVVGSGFIELPTINTKEQSSNCSS